MQSIDTLIEDVIAREGGYVDHPADRGGPTHWGITEAVARRQGYTGDMRALPESDAAAIYKRLYWLSPRFDAVAERAPTLAAELFDTGINMGTGTAAGFLQRAMNALNRNGSDYADIHVDRSIGPVTLSALDAFLAKRGKAGEAVLLKAVEALQGAGCALPDHRRSAPLAGGLCLRLARQQDRLIHARFRCQLSVRLERKRDGNIGNTDRPCRGHYRQDYP